MDFRNLARLCLKRAYSKAGFMKTSDHLKKKEAPRLQNEVALMHPKEAQHKRLMKHPIRVQPEEDTSSVNGRPIEHVRNRRVRIFQPAKNCMQSGTHNIDHWVIEFDNRERWENPLMGWSSTGDPLSNVTVCFDTKEAAVQYCERNGFSWHLQEVVHKRPLRPKRYAEIYAWDKRTRASTK